MRLGNAQSRLAAMLVLTSIFFMVEIVVGYITNSMALIADSFHMFSDAIALIIAFISVRMSPKKWSKNTFGWARAEILGALVNAVFLCALCFSILIESVKRFMKPDLIHEPMLILIVGGLGLFINLIGLLMFMDGGHHHHHHHGHSHTHKHKHKHHDDSPISENYLVCKGDNTEDGSELQKTKYGLLCKHRSHSSSQDFFCSASDHPHTPSPDNHQDNDESQLTPTKSHKVAIPSSGNGASSTHLHGHQKAKLDSLNNSDKSGNNSTADIHLTFRQTGKQDYGSSTAAHHHHLGIHDDHTIAEHSKVNHPTSSQMNMRGVFLHVLADAIGSVIVMISALVVKYTDWWIRPYIDPILSVFMVCLILRSTWPLLTESAMILLQTVPTHIEVDSLRRRLTQEIPGVLAVHEFHVWQLAGDRIIASAHIRCHNLQDYMRIAEKVKEFFHNEGIHSTTIQPEFTDFNDEVLNESDDNCALDCPSIQRPHCAPQTCCGVQKSTDSSGVAVGISGDDPATAAVLTRRSTNARLDSQLEGNSFEVVQLNPPSSNDIVIT